MTRPSWWLGLAALLAVAALLAPVLIAASLMDEGGADSYEEHRYWQG